MALPPTPEGVGFRAVNAMNSMMHAIELQEKRLWKVFMNQGQKIFSVIHLPQDQEHPPLIVIMHGFASHKVGTGRSYVRIAEALVKAGFGVLRFDFRGCGDSQGQLSEMGLEELISDASLVTHSLREEGFQKIGFFGSSLGGSISILTAARLKIASAIAVWAPVASGSLWVADYLKSHPENSLDTMRGVHLSAQFQEQFLKMDASKTVEELTGVPLLHFQGEQDETLSIKHQALFAEARKKSTSFSRFITYPETGHWLGLANIFPQVVDELIYFYQNHL